MTLYQNLIQRLRQTIATPQLMRVDKITLTPTTGGYTAGGEIVTPGTLQSTGQILTNIPISIPIATHTGAGIFTQSDTNQIAIINYLNGDNAHPIVTGFYTDQYAPSPNNTATINIHAGSGKIKVANLTTSLFTLLNDILTELMTLTTQGGPTAQVINPSHITKLGIIKTQLAQLMEQ